MDNAIGIPRRNRRFECWGHREGIGRGIKRCHAPYLTDIRAGCHLHHPVLPVVRGGLCPLGIDNRAGCRTSIGSACDDIQDGITNFIDRISGKRISINRIGSNRRRIDGTGGKGGSGYPPGCRVRRQRLGHVKRRIINRPSRKGCRIDGGVGNRGSIDGSGGKRGRINGAVSYRSRSHHIHSHCTN